MCNVSIHKKNLFTAMVFKYRYLLRVQYFYSQKGFIYRHGFL